jgi:hypothetical protein
MRLERTTSKDESAGQMSLMRCLRTIVPKPNLAKNINERLSLEDLRKDGALDVNF